MLGKNNTVLRRLRRLRRDAALRREENVFVAEGLHLAEEALATSADIELGLYSAALLRVPGGEALLDALRRRSPSLLETTPEALDSVQDARSAQPVLLVVRRPALDLGSCVPEATPASTVVVAHGIQDPGNLGSILRTTAASGARCLIVAGDAADLYHPRTVRGSMGAVFRLPCVAVADDDALLRTLRGRGYSSVEASVEAGTCFRERDWKRPSALFLGREADGLPQHMRDCMDEQIRIPLQAGVESLSVAAAAAVLLFEAARSREAGQESR